MSFKIIGLDLAGKEKNPSGFCILTEKTSETKIIYYDDDIIEEIKKEKPNIIAIDAPFSFPTEGYFREGDVLIRNYGVNSLSPKFAGMRPLVLRAIKLIKTIKECYETVIIEVFPRATEKILGMIMEEKANKDKYDALLCALTGKFYLEGKYETVGKEKIIVPKP